MVAVPDEKWGERVHASIVLKEGSEATAEDLIGEHSGITLRDTNTPRASTSGAIAKTSIGKIMRREVKKRYWEAGKSIA